MQFFIGCSTASPVTAAASSLQLRAISNFGTSSATAMTSCELKIIIEIEIGIFSPLFVVGLTHLKKAPPRSARPVPIQSEQLSCEKRQAIIKIAVSFCKQDYACFDNLATSWSTGKLPYCGGRALLKGREKNAGAVRSSPIFGVPLAQQPALRLVYDPEARAHSPCSAGQHRPDGGGYRRADDASFPPAITPVALTTSLRLGTLWDRSRFRLTISGAF